MVPAASGQLILGRELCQKLMLTAISVPALLEQSLFFMEYSLLVQELRIDTHTHSRLNAVYTQFLSGT